MVLFLRNESCLVRHKPVSIYVKYKSWVLFLNDDTALQWILLKRNTNADKCYKKYKIHRKLYNNFYINILHKLLNIIAHKMARCFKSGIVVQMVFKII